MLACPRKRSCDPLQPRFRDCGRVPACPRIHSCGCTVSVVQRLWHITTNSPCQVSPHSVAFFPIPANVAALWSPLERLPGWGSHMASTKCHPSRGTASPCVAYGPLRPCCQLLGICSSPGHYQVLSTGISNSVLHYRILTVLKPSPFSSQWFWGRDFLFSPL